MPSSTLDIRKLVLVALVALFVVPPTARTQSTQAGGRQAPETPTPRPEDRVLFDYAWTYPSPTSSGQNSGAYLELADLDQDGQLDVLSAQQAEVLVQLGKGGTLTTLGHLSLSGTPTALVAGDLNEDGFPDLCTTTYGPDSLVIFLGDGKGWFQVSSTIPLPDYATDIRLVDLNGDEHLDLVASTGASADGKLDPLPVFLGDGSGNLTMQAGILVADGPRALETIYLVGDSIPDLVVSDTAPGRVYVLRGNGDGTFTPSQTLSVGALAGDLAVADLDGDAAEDLLVGNGVELRTYFGLPDGTLAQNQALAHTGALWGAPAFGDLNSDLAPDLLFHDSRGIYVSFNAGDGNLDVPSRLPYLPGGRPKLADFDGDRRLDLLVSIGALVVLPGNGQGSFRQGQYLKTGGVTEEGPDGIATGEYRAAKTLAADLDQDGFSDTITLHHGIHFQPVLPGANNTGNHQILIHLGSPGGELSLRGGVAAGEWPKDVISRDLDGDGDLDLLVQSGGFGQTPSAVHSYTNDGTASFTITDAHTYPNFIDHFAVADVDNDLIPDLVTLSTTFPPSSHKVVRVRPGAGDGTFADSSAEIASVLGPAYLNLEFVRAVADTNNDGDLDLLFTGSSEGGIHMSLGDGAGAFGPPTIMPGTQGTPGRLGARKGSVIRDVNQDGLLDIIDPGAGSLNGGLELHVYLGQPGGSFASPIASSLEHGYFYYFVGDGDVDGDGNTDLLLKGEVGYMAFLSLLTGDGAGSFVPQRRNIALGDRYGDLAVLALEGQSLGDFDGDGDLDIAFPTNRTWNNESLDLNGDGLDEDPMIHGLFPARLGVFLNQQ